MRAVSRRGVAVAVVVGLGLGGGAVATWAATQPAPARPAPSPPLVATARFTYAAPFERERSVLSGLVRADAGGGPIAGALACAEPASDAAHVCVATGADGRFSMSVPVGYYKVHVVPPPGSRFVGEWYEDRDRPRAARLLDLRARDSEEVVVSLAAGRRVTGSARAARGGAAVVDAQACASSIRTPLDWVCVRTDAQGRYELILLPEMYSLFFVPPDGSRLLSRWWPNADRSLNARTLDVRSQDFDGIDVAFPEGHLILGTVRSDGGAPIENVFVCVDTAPFPTGRICRPTDKEGNYSVAVRTETYYVQFKAPASSRFVSEWFDGEPADPRKARRIAVRGDLRLDVSLTHGKMVWGKVTNLAGEPLESATLNVYDATRPCCVPVAATSTGRSGGWAVAVVAPGKYWVEVYPPLGTPYISRFYGGQGVETAAIVEVTTAADGDASFVDFALEEFAPR